MKIKQFLIQNNILYVIAALLIVAWGFGIVVYNANYLIDALLILAGFAIIIKLLTDKNFTRESSFFIKKKPQKRNETGENPF